MIQVKVKKLTQTAKIPTKGSSGAAGWDVYADKFELKDAETCNVLKVRTGIAVELPEGYELQVRPRSGLSSKGVMAVFGTVDSDYRGEVCVLLHISKIHEEIKINQGDRIAQFVIQTVPQVEFVEVTELSDTQRGNNGFGSTGK